MQAFKTFTGQVAPLDRANVDTDAIIPKQYLKSIQRTGFGRYLFDDWRYLDPGDLDVAVEQRRTNPDFVLNQSRFSDANILVANENFGCGSSREHAVWALQDYGFKVVIAPSFADIFFNNSFKNGFLPIVLEKQSVEEILQGAAKEADYRLTVDLSAQTVTCPDGTALAFAVDEFRKQSLLKGLDDIGHTLEQADDIRAYEARRRQEAPWLFARTSQA